MIVFILLTLRDLSLKQEYRSDRDDVVSEFFIPCLTNSIQYDRTIEFISVKSLSTLTFGLENIQDHHAKIRLVSGHRFGTSDLNAIIKLFDQHKTSKLNGRLYLDGNISVEEDSQSIKDRKNLSSNGYMEVTILVTPKGNIHQKPILTFKGLPINETEEFIYGLEEEIENTTKTFSLNSKKQEHNLIDAIKIVCRKYSKEKTGKKPFTNINLVRI